MVLGCKSYTFQAAKEGNDIKFKATVALCPNEAATQMTLANQATRRRQGTITGSREAYCFLPSGRKGQLIWGYNQLSVKAATHFMETSNDLNEQNQLLYFLYLKHKNLIALITSYYVLHVYPQIRVCKILEISVEVSSFM